MSTPLSCITARVDFDTQGFLQQAAAISGISSINSFVLNAAIEKAIKNYYDEHTFKLTKRDAVLLIDALDSGAKPNDRLQQAAKRYDKKEQ